MVDRFWDPDEEETPVPSIAGMEMIERLGRAAMIAIALLWLVAMVLYFAFTAPAS